MVLILNSVENRVLLVSDFPTQEYLTITVCFFLKMELFLPLQKLKIALLRQQRENGVIFHSTTRELNMTNAQQRITVGHGVPR